MPPQTPNQDNYFASIKKFFIPFILINIIAVILGASLVNVFNILDRQSLSSRFANEKAEDSPDVPANEKRDSLKLVEVTSEATNPVAQSAKTNNEELTQTEATTQEKVKSIFLPTLSNQKVSEPVQSELFAYPAPADEIDFEKVTDSTKDEQSVTSVAKISPISQNDDLIANLEKDKSEEPLAPVRQLILPTVDVSTPIIDIPIVEGNWDISKLEQDAGVLDGFSSHPDDPGVLVIAAHATTQWPTAGPFADLRLMGLGDPIVYQVGDTEYVYEISRFLRVDTSNVDVLRKNGEDGIVLVTCGSYNYFTGEYGSRLIAYGNLKETRPASLELQEKVDFN